MKILIVMCVVIFFTKSVYNMRISELLSEIPGWDTISTTWDKMIVAIKNPVRIKRLGSVGKRKSTANPGATQNEPTPIFSMSTAVPKETSNEKVIPLSADIHSSPDKSVSMEMPPELRKIAFVKHADTKPEPGAISGDGKVKVPYIPEPVWKTLEDWEQMQKPHFVKIVRGESADIDFEALIVGTEKRLTNIPENERFGVLMFVR